MMTIADAARATRRYSVYHAPGDQCWYVSAAPDIIEFREFGVVATLTSYREAQAACDLLNLLAVLEAIREPSENVARAAREMPSPTLEDLLREVVVRMTGRYTL